MGVGIVAGGDPPEARGVVGAEEVTASNRSKRLRVCKGRRLLRNHST